MNGGSSEPALESKIYTCLLACRLVRISSKVAFSLHERSMSALDVLRCINSGFKAVIVESSQ